MSTPLHELVYSWHRTRAQGRPLWIELRELLDRMTSNHPHAYFELGQRDEAALDSLANRVFTRCDRVPRAPDPFRGRVPFRAYTEDQLPSRPIRYHTVFAWRSVGREVIRDDYRKNVRRDPALRWRDGLYRALGPILRQGALPDELPDGRRPRWQSARVGLRRVRSVDEALTALRGLDLPWDAARALEPAALEPLALAALDLLGRPISQSALAHLLADLFDDNQARAASQDEAFGLRLAAASAEPPATRTFSNGSWRVRWGTRTDGGATVMLLGPEPALLLVSGLPIALTPRVWTPVETPAPPAELLLRLPDGKVIALKS